MARIKKHVLWASLLLLFLSCNKDETQEDIDSRNRDEIVSYIESNNLDAKSTASGLYYVIENEGTGLRPTATSDVKVTYKGYLTDGTVFDQNNSGITFNLQQVIPGWTEGIQLFKEGGNGILLIPSKLGYGPQGAGDIPGNAVIIFDVELLDVIQ